MTRQDAQRLQAALGDWMARVQAEARMGAEVQRARREFFGAAGAPARTDPSAAALAEQRFQEWFLLERESEVLGDVPAAASTRFSERGLHGSIVGVFRIQSIHGGTAEASDLQDEDANAIRELAMPAGTARVGDVLVGRLYPRKDGSWQPSAAVALYQPGAGLAAAFARDLEQLGLERRLSQVELEHLLLRGGAAGRSPAGALPPVEHLEADLEQLLRSGGAEVGATELSQMLLAAERPGPVIGPLLDQLAFDTAIDLDRARSLLHELWAALHEGAEPPPPPEVPAPQPGETLGEQLARRLDEGLAKRRDIGELFAELEAMAGIEPEETDDRNPFDGDDGDEAEEEAGAGGEEGERRPGRADYGDLEPLVQEFLWERELGADTEAARTLRQWVELQNTAAAPRTDVELATARDLLRVLLHRYLAAPPGEREAAVRAAFGTLGAFYDWLAATQELDFRGVLAECRGSLLDQLDRLAAASRALSSAAMDDAPQPALLRVLDVDRHGIRVRGDSTPEVHVGTPAAAQLRAGDLLLGALARTPRGPAFTGMVVALPADAEALMS